MMKVHTLTKWKYIYLTQKAWEKDERTYTEESEVEKKWKYILLRQWNGEEMKVHTFKTWNGEEMKTVN